MSAPTQDLINERPSTSAGGSSPVSAASPASPGAAPEYHSPAFHPPHSHADIEQEAHEVNPHHHVRITNNYEQALRDRAAATGKQEHKDAIAQAYSSGCGADAPPATHPGRQQSFKMSDQKRAAMEHIFSGHPKSSGYTTSAKK
ncbi:hypothetical protein AUEXF2481DRAFT_27023 [Aureobasidium subglaciale EXF-2481]|uniref:Uncharacterized protein n=1 Tax=Aureobasidium subglaciale (strain EXF-2481) TaxID=1043005 RepID=A0A074YIQ6_AURSE|nr:uncharacterized protein AUEXF2481DRAFT_27023 [Aureobasidium subglaciale EXF-2481]KAI5195066.1 hypothetical protein E4T38_09272 [Aureobasidium subglaciale]KAI5214122.1 hypothetical protein E4T40_09223 [Aureobasidium subglaciale]KAI5216571.1 hypothetical protein E4T41_09224 [Aureobasidium subglaciale]KAI5254454.1 hypothetical protein E4T46_09179 [Aureobasidium subglaciale]KEQ97653.1 hypothetical protein AUEXF2481DRAFT_27023 [Aureobasidium subglaciale EXF-2481]